MCRSLWQACREYGDLDAARGFLRRAEEIEARINDYQKRSKKAAQKRLRTGSAVKAEMFYLDVLRHIEHIGDYSLHISHALTAVR